MANYVVYENNLRGKYEKAGTYDNWYAVVDDYLRHSVILDDAYKEVIMDEDYEQHPQNKIFNISEAEYYFDKYVHIEVKKTNAELVQPFRLWPKQKEALLSICEHRLNIILKARQLGFSWMACGEASRLMITRSGRTVIALSRSEEEAKELKQI